MCNFRRSFFALLVQTLQNTQDRIVCIYAYIKLQLFVDRIYVTGGVGENGIHLGCGECYDPTSNT